MQIVEEADSIENEIQLQDIRETITDQIIIIIFSPYFSPIFYLLDLKLLKLFRYLL